MFALSPTKQTHVHCTNSHTLSLYLNLAVCWIFFFIHSPKHNNFWSMKFVNGKLLAIITSSLKFQWISASKLIFLQMCVYVCYPSPTMCFYLLGVTLHNHLQKKGRFLDILLLPCCSGFTKSENAIYKCSTKWTTRRRRRVLRNNFISIKSWLRRRPNNMEER